jgi:hypothetical protein
MSTPVTEPARIHLRPGVLFVATRSGGTLMDLSGNRYIALSPESALIWSGLAEGRSRADLVERLAQAKCLDCDAARGVFERQLRLWQDAKLVSHRDRPQELLPQPKLPADAEAMEIDEDAVARAALSVVLVAKLMLTEIGYRRRLRNEGLARTLVRLQREARTEPCDENPAPALHRTLRAYHALRRPYKQSLTARDCLVRSLGLTAVLRRNGVCADLCIGVIDLPFQAHAWVEGNGLVLNEVLSKRRQYVVIGRF